MKIIELLNKARKAKTYTREQILTWTDETLDRKARQILGTKDSIPATCTSDSWWLQEHALRHGKNYLSKLYGVVFEDFDYPSLLDINGIEQLFNATPRQRTQAAILAMMESGGTGE